MLLTLICGSYDRRLFYFEQFKVFMLSTLVITSLKIKVIVSAVFHVDSPVYPKKKYFGIYTPHET